MHKWTLLYSRYKSCLSARGSIKGVKGTLLPVMFAAWRLERKRASEHVSGTSARSRTRKSAPFSHLRHAQLAMRITRASVIIAYTGLRAVTGGFITHSTKAQILQNYRYVYSINKNHNQLVFVWKNSIIFNDKKSPSAEQMSVENASAKAMNLYSDS